MRTITDRSIFGDYKKTEDRITAALLHIINRGGHMLCSYLFDELDLPEQRLNVVPQSLQTGCTADGLVMREGYQILIESKAVKGQVVKSNTHSVSQLSAYNKLVNRLSYQYVVYVTPDLIKPKLLGSDIDWISWNDVSARLQAYKDATHDEVLVFLIDQLEILLTNTVYNKSGKVMSQNEKVIIVGGSWAEDVALTYGFYACQPNRYFNSAQYIAYCHKHRIKYLFEIISEQHDIVLTTIGTANMTNYLANKEPNYAGDKRDYYELKKVCDFSPEITNDKVDGKGNPCAFTQRQKYTTYNKITKATVTSQL